jgi:hypothetical protein
VYAALGEKQKTLDWLQVDYDDHHAGIFYLRSDPLLKSVADEPRFKSLMTRIWPGN